MAMRKHAAAALDGRANFIRIARKWARIAASPWKSNLGLGIQIHAEARRREEGSLSGRGHPSQILRVLRASA